MCGACCFPRYRPTIQSAHFARIPGPGSSNGVRDGDFHASVSRPFLPASRQTKFG